jgi:phosphatidylserine decarboxylase
MFLLIGFIVAVSTGFVTSYIHKAIGYFPVLFSIPLNIIFIIFFTSILILYSFYRDPERSVPLVENVILSPADGIIQYIQEINKDEIIFSSKKKQRFELKELTKTDLFKNGAYLIGIEMRLLDIHVNRSPVSGKIIFQKNTRGKFLSLRKFESIFENERLTTIIEAKHFNIAVIQIASRMIRRIVSYHRAGDVIKMGQRIGMIKFGSQVDLIIPKLNGLIIDVKLKDRVTAGISSIAQYDSEKENK